MWARDMLLHLLSAHDWWVPRPIRTRTDTALLVTLTLQPVQRHLPFPPPVVKKGRLVGCQARSERLNVYVIQMFGPDQAERDTTGSHEWAKPFTWCEPMSGWLFGRAGKTRNPLQPEPEASTRLLLALAGAMRLLAAMRHRTLVA